MYYTIFNMYNLIILRFGSAKRKEAIPRIA